MSTDNNMRVINKEYERVLDNPDNIIMSDGLRELMGLDFDQEKGEPIAEENKLSIIIEPPECATIIGNLHTLQFVGETNRQSLSMEISKCNPEIMQALHDAKKNTESKPVNIVLTGDNGFEADDCTISSFGIVKIASNTFLLTVTFESEHVLF